MFFNNKFYLFGQQAFFYSLSYPYNSSLNFSEEEYTSFIFSEQDKISKVSKKLDILSWINVNSFVSISLNDWFHLSYYVREAIKLEVKAISDKQERELKSRKQEADLMKAELNSSLKFMNQSSYLQTYTK